MLVCGASAAAGEPVDPAPTDKNAALTAADHPRWIAIPSGDDVARVYPPAASKAGVSGRAIISCTVTVAGKMNDCAIVAEDPPAMGFGQAALKLQNRFAMAPKTQLGGDAGGATVRIPIRFVLRP